MENNKKDETAPTKPMREPFVDAAYGGAYAPTYIPPAGTRRARPCTCPDLLQTSEAFARFRWAALPRPSKCPKLSQNRSGRVKKGRKIPGENRENKVAIFDLAKAPPKSQILPVQSLSRRRRACTDMSAGRVPNGGTAVTAWSAHGDIP